MPISKKGTRTMFSLCKSSSQSALWRYTMLPLLLFFLTLSAWTPARATTPGKDLRILRITPTGLEAPPGRQIVIQFDRPVVPLGRMERSAAELPITIEPQLNCQWRWLNPSNLACNLGEKDALQPATEYSLVVAPGITTEDKVTLAETVNHKFSTIRPRITMAWFKTWLGPQLPQSSVRGNLPMDLASLSGHLFYQAGGRRIPAKVEEDPDYPHSPHDKDNLIWQVSPSTNLPAGVPVQLQAEPGIISTRGGLPGIERRVLDTVQAIPDFRFLGVRCTSKNNKSFNIAPGPPSASPLRCLPSGGITLLFSAPVLPEDIREGLQFTPPLSTGSPDADPWEQVYSYSQLSEPFSKGKRYTIDLPESILKPFNTYRLQIQADAVKDQFGRSLAANVDMSFSTDHRLPDYALLKNMPVLEKDLDTDAHVWAVNLNELRLKYKTVTADGNKSPGSSTIKPVGPSDTSIPVPLTIRQILGQPSGVVQGQFVTQPALPEKSPQESWFFAQVTPFQVHLKLGHHNSMVWVTDLRTGLPAADVNVQVFKNTFKEFGNPADALATAATGKDGVATLPGVTTLDPGLKHVYVNDTEEQSLFIHCQKDGDIAVLPVRYDYQVAAEGANREYIPDWLRPLYGHIRVWGATAQGIYRAGDTMQYKIFVRDQNNLRFTRAPGIADSEGKSSEAAPEKPMMVSVATPTKETGADPAGQAPPRYNLKVFDPLGKIAYEQNDIVLSSFGAFHGEVTLAQNGVIGWYRFVVTSNFHSGEWEAMRVLVSDFTPAPFKVVTDLNGKSFSTGDEVAITSSAKLHAGGPYSSAATKVTATLEIRPFAVDNPKISGFQFDSAEKPEGRKAATETLFENQGHLDDNGQLVEAFTIVENPIWYGQLTVESSVQDDRGKSIANRSSAPCFGRDRYVGVLQEDWTLQENKKAIVRVVAVDRDGGIITGVPITVTTEHKKTWGARVKGAGDGYHTEYQHQWEPEQQMTGVSTAEPLEFVFTPTQAGDFRLIATLEDSAGRSHSTVIERWVTGKGVVLWESTAGNLLNVYPEKSGYSVGDTARFLVQNPFPGAQALITVERFGVIDHWTKVFSDSSEIIEIPVLPDYLPGFYVSVIVTSPRIEQPPGPQGEDLGKPAYRMGYVKVPVKDPYKELIVDVRADKETYKPRDTVRVDLQVRPRNPGIGEASLPVELAVAVLDEAVFDLIPEGRKRFDPYKAFYSLDELDLSNYNLLMQLVGRENLTLKGAGAGGDGGPDLSMRSLFKFVSYWNPALSVDEEGKASISFEVPDNLTGWRVLAMAVSPEDRMGLGEGLFKVNQATEIRPALPNQVLEGDRFSAGFTLMNRTDKARTLSVNFLAEGPVKGDDAPTAEPGTVRIGQQIYVEPFHRKTLRFPLQTTGSGPIALSLTAGDEVDKDGLSHTLQISKRQQKKVAASYGMTTEATIAESILFPDNMREDTGELTLLLSPTVIGGVAGAFTHVKEYPYSCWEQKLAQGVMAAMYTPLSPYLNTDVLWPDNDKTVQETLALAPMHQAPNGGMTYYTAKDEFVSPYLSAFTALAFNWLRQQGYEPPELIEQRLQTYLLNLLRHDSLPQEFSKGMTATVRAVTLAALAERGKVTLADVQRYRAHLPAMNLFGKSFFLRALLITGSFIDQQQEVLDSILTHADQSSGQVTFNHNPDSGFQALLSSPTRDNAAILGGLLAWLKANPSDAAVSDLAVRLMRGLTLSRKGRDHWAGTQENLFVVKALYDYAHLFELEAPEMKVSGRLDQESLGSGRFNAYTDPPLSLQRPMHRGDAGRKAQLHVEKEGEGRLYYNTRLTYSPAYLSLDAVNAGIEVFREYSVKRDGKWSLQNGDISLHTGEVVKVDLYVSLPAERYFVVLEDPVPGGLEPVNRDLATTSQQDVGSEKEALVEGSYKNTFSDWREDTFSRWSFYHRELRHDAVRYYSERLAPGRYHLSYTAQAIAPGEFQILPLHAEEMYAPDVYGTGVPVRLRIQATE
ncbi:MAG: large extracellular alpha-helical protein [Proteobacteria bacterium]|nr:large extracellular alpha-helical protein [Pseudomonadota bacterium]